MGWAGQGVCIFWKYYLVMLFRRAFVVTVLYWNCTSNLPAQYLLCSGGR